jgi:hypothetical protein
VSLADPATPTTGVRLVPVDWEERQILGKLDAKAELGWSTGVGHEMRELVRRLIERYDQAEETATVGDWGEIPE